MELDEKAVLTDLMTQFFAAKGSSPAEAAEQAAALVASPPEADDAQEAENFVLTPPDDHWPAPCAPAAFHGLAGEVVKTLAPCTEADPAALLIQFLAAFGNCLGRGPHWQVGQDKHFGNLFCVLVGRSPKDRKGGSLGTIMRLFLDHKHEYLTNLRSGLSSAEGLLWQVRDEMRRLNAEKDKYDILDPGVRDKRMLLVESEFSQVLQHLGCQGNALSPMLHRAWGTGNLGKLAPSATPLTATGAHISLIGHITQRELQRWQATVSAARGLSDHFLWVCVKRAKLLPQGGQPPKDEMVRLNGLVQSAVDFAKGYPRLMQRDAEAEKLWGEVIYPRLSAEREGVAASACGRAEAQTMRLAMLYALLDLGAQASSLPQPFPSRDREGAVEPLANARGSEPGETPAIRRCHLEAAWALWRYCEASAHCLFGDSLGDPLADKLALVLSRWPSGLTRYEISSVFMRNIPSAKITQALACLWRAGQARYVREKKDGSGRPSEKWFFVEGGTK